MHDSEESFRGRTTKILKGLVVPSDCLRRGRAYGIIRVLARRSRAEYGAVISTATGD